jgi:hypothetical protein
VIKEPAHTLAEEVEQATSAHLDWTQPSAKTPKPSLKLHFDLAQTIRTTTSDAEVVEMFIMVMELWRRRPNLLESWDSQTRSRTSCSRSMLTSMNLELMVNRLAAIFGSAKKAKA